MEAFYHAPNFSFQDFDLIVEGDILYATYIKKVPYSPDDHDSKKPNHYALAKSLDGVTWEEEGIVVQPVPASWEESIWAGSITKKDDQYVVYYTGVKEKIRNDSCKIGKAYSHDLIHWEKDKNNPVLVFNSENPFYSEEKPLAFRDPFPFTYQGKQYVFLCAKDKFQPAGKRGCVGIFEEMKQSQFKWMAPVFSPGIYSDGLECPALYEIKDRWYLFYGDDEEMVFRYAIGESPFGPFTIIDNVPLLPKNSYNYRIVRFKGRLVLYYWIKDTWEGKVRDRLAPPKGILILKDGKITLFDLG